MIAEILLINPNTNTNTTKMLGAIAAARLTTQGLTGKFIVNAVSVSTGPPVIVEPTELHAAESAVLACAKESITARTVAVIVGAIGDPGVVTLQRNLLIPVVGIGEASIADAARGGRRFGIVTTTPLLAKSLQALVLRHGRKGVFTGLRLTDSDATILAADSERQLRELMAACRRCRDDDGAETVIIGGGPLGDSARILADSLDMTIVQPVPAAIDRILGSIDAETIRDVF